MATTHEPAGRPTYGAEAPTHHIVAYVGLGLVLILAGLGVIRWIAPGPPGPESIVAPTRVRIPAEPAAETSESGEGDAEARPTEESPTAQPAASAAGEPQPPGEAPDDMVWIPGGTFWMGANDPSEADAVPVHLVKVDGFWMDQTEVTNRQFAAFVKATGYVTVAEKVPDAKDFPDAPPEKLKAGSIVFTPPKESIPLTDPFVWWTYVPGADWRHPQGPDSTVEGKDDYPVVHVCYEDAAAYAAWAKKRLPTEAEWEFAARGGMDRKKYMWGDERNPDGKWMANNFQGRFPGNNVALDGYAGVAPVAKFPPNPYGLYDLSGNVWEWCADWYRPEYQVDGPGPLINPQGPTSSHDPEEPGVPKRVQRGGSYLCSDQYCVRYLAGARGKGATDSGHTHVGFRCVRSAR